MTVLRLDFVSDISCPWCALALSALTRAIDEVGDELQVDFHCQPFELNPDMGPAGEDLIAHLGGKYGVSPAQIEAMHAGIAQRGAALGVMFSPERTRIYNTLDAHRLLHWAGEAGPAGAQKALKQALFEAYFGQARNPGDPDLLVRLAASVGLDAEQARAVVDSRAFADVVRSHAQQWRARGIQSVPAVILDNAHCISGAQPPEVYVQALRDTALLGM